VTLALGLDVSLGRTGVALATGQTRSIKTHDERGGHRLDLIMERLDPMLMHGPPVVAVIEGYSPGGIQGLTMARLGELGGCIRRRLYQLGIPYFEVAPKQLKKYATGSGGASKDDMIVAAETAGARPSNDDEADAWWLRQMAVDYAALKQVQFEREADPTALAAYRFDVLLGLDTGWPV
jgi:Holliday junction resolvasome RuvABC endonuclease subunit